MLQCSKILSVETEPTRTAPPNLVPSQLCQHRPQDVAIRPQHFIVQMSMLPRRRRLVLQAAHKYNGAGSAWYKGSNTRRRSRSKYTGVMLQWAADLLHCAKLGPISRPRSLPHGPGERRVQHSLQPSPTKWQYLLHGSDALAALLKVYCTTARSQQRAPSLSAVLRVLVCQRSPRKIKGHVNLSQDSAKWCTLTP